VFQVVIVSDNSDLNDGAGKVEIRLKQINLADFFKFGLSHQPDFGLLLPDFALAPVNARFQASARSIQ
jgi:hypothetical protein